MPSILPPISLPLLIHTRPIPIPLPFRSQPTHLQPPAHSSSAPILFPFCPQPTPSPPLLPELVHLLPCLLLQATYSPVPSFSCPLATFPCLFSHTTCSLVSPSTRQLTMLLSELVHLLPCLLIQLTCSLIHSLIRFIVNYFYHLTFLSVLVQNTATLILPSLSPTSTVKNITINNTSH